MSVNTLSSSPTATYATWFHKDKNYGKKNVCLGVAFRETYLKAFWWEEEKLVKFLLTHLNNMFEQFLPGRIQG